MHHSSSVKLGTATALIEPLMVEEAVTVVVSALILSDHGMIT
jgi:hypothetical protein